MDMLVGVHSYFRVEMEELIHLTIKYGNNVFVSQHEGWAWDKIAWNGYGYKPDRLTFLDGDRSIINDKSHGLSFIFSSNALVKKANKS